MNSYFETIFYLAENLAEHKVYFILGHRQTPALASRFLGKRLPLCHITRVSVEDLFPTS